jgi:hypothetical protein
MKICQHHQIEADWRGSHDLASDGIKKSLSLDRTLAVLTANMLSPSLHHGPALFQKVCSVICRLGLIPDFVGQGALC